MNVCYWPTPVLKLAEFRALRATAFHHKAVVLEPLIVALSLFANGQKLLLTMCDYKGDNMALSAADILGRL